MPPAPRPRPRPLPLSEVATLLGLAAESQGSVTISGVSNDSRGIHPGDLYAALPGRVTHGAEFAHAAVERGAVAILTDPGGADACRLAGIPVLVVTEPRSRLGAVASLVYGHPAAELQIIGVTGTNGKTTVTAMIDAGLRAAGRVTGRVGTVGVRVGDRAYSVARTTPEAAELHALLGYMRDEGVTSVVMEVSSIAIREGRVDGIVYDIAAFTNLSQDHLDYHGTMEAYFAAKAELFTAERARFAIIGTDDEWGRRLAGQCRIPFETWSASDPLADWALAWGAGRGSVLDPDGRMQRLDLSMPGAFNEANAVCALAVLHRAGVDRGVAAAAIGAASVPGRMQIVGRAGGIIGIVDYAHSPDAIERVLVASREAAEGRVIAVVGAGGDRDRGKRPQMGAIAARLADVVVITDDNPRSEDAAAIRSAIRAGAADMAPGERAELHEEADRARAISVAAGMAEAGDVVVVLGKGHEQGQEVAGVVTPFDDATALADALAARGRP